MKWAAVDKLCADYITAIGATIKAIIREAHLSAGRQVAINGTTLWIEDTGEVGMPAVLCLHSLFLDGRMFDHVVEALRGRYRVVRPDFRGQGRSARAMQTLIDMETCAQDIAALVEGLELKGVHVLAQSMGGDVAVRLIAANPGLYRSLTLLGTSAQAEPPEQLAAFRGAADAMATQGFTGEVLETVVGIMFGESTRRDLTQRAMLNLWRTRIEALPTSIHPAVVGVIERSSSMSLVPQLRLPVIMFAGSEDRVRPLVWSREVVDQLPRGELVELEGIGHSVILEAPDIVVPRIQAFLDSN